MLSPLEEMKILLVNSYHRSKPNQSENDLMMSISNKTRLKAKTPIYIPVLEVRILSKCMTKN